MHINIFQIDNMCFSFEVGQTLMYVLKFRCYIMIVEQDYTDKKKTHNLQQKILQVLFN